MVKYIYLLTGPLWRGKDKRICTNEEQAIQLSLQYPMAVVEVFIKWSNPSTGEEIYYPTGCYYYAGFTSTNVNR
jgi:hypothetical protein